MDAAVGFGIPGYSGLRLIGRGGFAAVYQARQEAYDRSVAVKVIDVGLGDEATRRRFQRECAATGRLTGHPNIMTIFESGFVEDGRPYLTMALCSGGSLAERMVRDGPLPVADVLRVGVKIAGALQTAHANGIVHRDIKPENILVSGFGEPALADFGISTIESRSATKRTQAYTPNHAPPEVLRGELASAASDIYTFGSTLYELLAGHPPFEHTGHAGLATFVDKVLNEEPPALDTAAESLDRILRTAMAKEPAQRFGSAAAMGVALQGVQRELGLKVDDMVVADPGAATPAAPAADAAATMLGERAAPLPEPMVDEEDQTTGGKRAAALIALAVLVVLLLGGGAATMLLTQRSDVDRADPQAPAVTTETTTTTTTTTTTESERYTAPAACGQIDAGEAITEGATLVSCDGRITLELGDRGNLVLTRDGASLWESGPAGRTAVAAVMRDDGNFVIENTAGKALWSTGTSGHPGARFQLQDDANLVVYHPDDGVLWASGSCLGCG